MAKASRPGNQAVAGITAAVTDEERFPDYTAANNSKSSSQTGAGSSANKSTTKSSSSTTVKNTSSTSAKTGTRCFS